jgi:hypothetical protein
MSLNITSDILTVGDTDTLTATVTPGNATNKTVAWKSSDSTIATVDNTGLVTAVSEGTATITAETVDGSKIASCIVTIIIPVTSVTLNIDADDLIMGEMDTLIATVAPSTATNKTVEWTSSDDSVATVDNTGKITTLREGTATITATTADGSKTASCFVTASNKGYVKSTEYTKNPKTQVDLKVRSEPILDLDDKNVVGRLYNYENIEVLDTAGGIGNDIIWYKIFCNGNIAYVSSNYIQLYTSPPDGVVTVARGITKQFEVGNSDQIAWDSDEQGLSLGYLQWCIGQQTLQPLLNRMDRQYNADMREIFGTNYDTIHSKILGTPENQLEWARSINNDSTWRSQLVKLSEHKDFISIEHDAETYYVKQAMIICDKYKLNTVRGFALAFDIAVQNGSISSNAVKAIDADLVQTPDMDEKTLLVVIANAVATDNSGNISEDIRSRKMAIVNGEGIVHKVSMFLDTDYGLSDSNWR